MEITMIETINDYKYIFESIKNDIKNTRFKIIENANIELINLYFRFGKIIDDNWKYGNNFINELSIELKLEFPDMKGLSPRNLRRMRIFYNEYKDIQNWPVPLANLPWTHNYTLIEKVKDKDRLSVEWALEGINNPIGVSSFELDKYIPKDILEKLPTEADLNLHININDTEKFNETNDS